MREEAEVPRRRYRPVFADQQQWLKGDARLERELRPWMERWRELVRKADGDVWKAAADARAAGITLDHSHYNGTVDTVGGSTPMAWTNLTEVKLAGHEIRDVRAAVVRNGLGVSLLGQNMLARLDSVTIEADRLSLR